MSYRKVIGSYPKYLAPNLHVSPGQECPTKDGEEPKTGYDRKSAPVYNFIMTFFKPCYPTVNASV